MPFNKIATSRTILQSKEQYAKSRKKLIGSIVLLFIGLLVFIDVTTNVKLAHIKPNIVEIRNTANPSTVNIQDKHESNINVTTITESAPYSSNTVTNESNIKQESSLPKTTVSSSSIVTINSPHNAVESKKSAHHSHPTVDSLIDMTTGGTVTANIITIKSRPNAIDILDGKNDSTNNKYYIQLIVSKEQLSAAKASLAKQKMSNSMHKTHNQYYFKIGPFTNSNRAKEKMILIKHSIQNT